MKNYVVYKIKDWAWLNFDRRKKIFRGITREEFLQAKDRHFAHLRKNCGVEQITRCNTLRVLDILLNRVGSSYEKVIIEGNKHLYIASPIYLHADYNKSIFAKNTPENRRKAELINKLLGKARKTA